MVRKRMNNSDTCSTTAPTRANRSYTDADKLAVKECLAVGYSQNQTSKITNIPQQNISYWYADPKFQQEVADMTAAFLASRENVHEQMAGLSQLVIHQALTGERKHDDPTVELAFRFLAETEWPIRRGGTHKRFGQA